MNPIYTISIEYCSAWGYRPRAVRATDELLSSYQHLIRGITLVPSRGGVFEVTINDELVFSKKALGRHVEEGELEAILEKMVGPDTPKFQ